VNVPEDLPINIAATEYEYLGVVERGTVLASPAGLQASSFDLNPGVFLNIK
jgi:hypothetical protein